MKLKIHQLNEQVWGAANLALEQTDILLKEIRMAEKKTIEIRKSLRFLQSLSHAKPVSPLVPKVPADTPLVQLELPDRCKQVFEWIGISTIGELSKMTASQLLKYRNFGKFSLQQTRAAMAARGYELAEY